MTASFSCRGLVTVVALAAGAAVVAACGSAAFVCQSDVQCGSEGFCEGDGRCSVPDAACPSGRRYAEYAGSQSGTCVAESVTGAGTDPTGDATVTTTTTTATTSSTTSTGTTATPTTTGAETSTGEMTTTTSDTSSGTSTTGGELLEGCPPDDPSLVLCLDFSTVGEVIPDLSGNGYDATASGLVPVASPWGSAAGFDASSLVLVSMTDGLGLTDPFSIEVWFEFDALPVAPDRIGIIDKNDSFGMFVRQSGALSCGGGLGASFGALTPGDWTYAACVHDAGRYFGYIDGQPVGSGDSPAASNTNDIAIGADFPDLDERLVGGIRLIRVWSTALDASTIAGTAGP